MEPIKTIKLDATHRVEIYYDDSLDSPRDWGQDSKLCIREHRRYSFPNELKYDWDSAEEDAGKLYEEYWVFPLDFYDHGNVQFSLSGQGMQCQFDTAKNCGFIAIPKHIEWDNGPGYSGSKDYTVEEAKKIAKQEVLIYSQYLNGEVYGYRIFVSFPSITVEGKEYEADDDIIESSWGYYDMEAMPGDINNQEWKEAFTKGLSN